MRTADIKRILPTVLQLDTRPDSPLEALLAVMETLHQPVEDILEDIDAVIDPYRTPVRFLPMLAQWLDVGWLWPDVDDPTSSPVMPSEASLRNLLAAAPALSAARGTADGLRRFLELAVGQTGFEIDDRSGRPFHIQVNVPASAEPALELVRRIVAVQKPAHVTAEVRVAAPPPEEPR